MFRNILAAITLAAVAGCGSSDDDDNDLEVMEHSVAITSTAPSMAGQSAQLYVRELKPDGIGRPAVLFVHGAGTPAEVSFDSKMEDYSWMRQVANAGFDVFSVSLTGYGRSTRPAPMADPCNIQESQRAPYVSAPCEPSYVGPITTMSSDWNDIDQVVEHIRRLRGVDRVSLVAWSQGGPRVTGYAALNPGKVERIVVLAPAYNREGLPAQPDPLPTYEDGPMTVQSRQDFMANWERQVGCTDQYDQAAAEAIFDEMLESDSVGAQWGSGVRRAPRVPTWGFNRTAVAQVTTPYLMVAADHDKQVPPERVHQLYEDLGSPNKVLVDLACSSHNAMWERNREVLFDATVQWLRNGTLNGVSSGIVRLGE
jgi:pimeloyl-ACP methyl ester carboxylesterase